MSASAWKKCRLRDIAYIYRGGNFQKNDFTPEGKPCIHYGQMYTHFGTFTDKVLTYLPEDIFKKSRIAVSNDVIMAITSETVEDVCRCIAWIGKEDIAISGHTAIIHHQQDAKFLSYYFHSASFFTQKSRVAHGSKVIEMNPSDLEKTTIVLPQDLNEQKRISTILSTCDTVIQKTQKTMDKYKAIKQGLMQDLFTRGLTKDGKLRPSFKDAPELYKESELGMIPKEWEVKIIRDFGTIVTGSTPSTKRENYYGNDYMFISPFDISEDNKYIYGTEKKLTIDGLNVARKIPERTICVVCIGSTIGKAAITTELSCSNQQINALIPNDSDISDFLYYSILWNTPTQFRANVGLQAVPIVNKSQYEKFNITVPNKDEQIAIAKRLSSIDSTIQKEEAILEKYKNIKTGLMARLLTPPEDAEIIDETGETL